MDLNRKIEPDSDKSTISGSVYKIGGLLFLTFFLGLTTVIKLRFFSQPSLWPDEALYLFIARNLSSDPLNLTDITGRMFYHSPPLLMYLLSLVERLPFMEFDRAARGMIIFMSVGTVVTTFFIGKKIYHPAVGLIAAALLAVCPLNNWIGVRIMTDVPVVFFIYLAICMMVYEKKTAFYAFGVCAVLTKYSAFPVLFLPLLFRLKPRVWAIFYAGLFIFLFVFVGSKRFYLTPEWGLSYFYNFFQFPDMLHMVEEARFFLGFFLIGLAVIGIVMTAKDKNYSVLFHWFCLFGIFRFFLPWVIFRVSRYTLPIYPALFIIAAYGCYGSVRLVVLKWPVYRKWAILFFAVSISSVLFSHSIKSMDLLQNTANTFIGFKEAAEFLKNQHEAHKIATASPRQMKYFAPELDVYDIHSNISPENLAVFLRKHEIQYLLIDFWSPHLPEWCRTYDYRNSAYQLVYSQYGVNILNVSQE